MAGACVGEGPRGPHPAGRREREGMKLQKRGEDRGRGAGIGQQDGTLTPTGRIQKFLHRAGGRQGALGGGEGCPVEDYPHPTQTHWHGLQGKPRLSQSHPVPCCTIWLPQFAKACGTTSGQGTQDMAASPLAQPWGLFLGPQPSSLISHPELEPPAMRCNPIQGRSGSAERQVPRSAGTRLWGGEPVLGHPPSAVEKSRVGHRPL